MEAAGSAKKPKNVVKPRRGSKMSVANVNKPIASPVKQAKKSAIRAQSANKSLIKTHRAKKQRVVDSEREDEEEISPEITRSVGSRGRNGRSRSRSMLQSPDPVGEVLVEVEGQETEYASEMDEGESGESVEESE